MIPAFVLANLKLYSPLLLIAYNYIVPGKATYEPIVQDEAVDSFEDYVVEKIDRYRGCSIDDLCTEFEVEIKKRPKNLKPCWHTGCLG